MASWFSDGVAEIELVDAIVTDDVVCLVMVEHCEAAFESVDGRHRWVLRTSEIYRHGEAGWSVVHRHAEPLIESRNLVETLELLKPRL